MKRAFVLMLMIIGASVPLWGVQAQQNTTPPPGFYDALADFGQRVGVPNLAVNCTEPGNVATCSASDPALTNWTWQESVYNNTGVGCPQAFANVQNITTRAYKYEFTYKEVIYTYYGYSDRSVLIYCGSTANPNEANVIDLGTLPQPQDPACPIPPQLTVGNYAQVTAENGVPNNLRSGPDRSFQKIGEIPAGGVFLVLEGPVCTAEFVYWRVEYNGLQGWTVEGNKEEYFAIPMNDGPLGPAPVDLNLGVDSLTADNVSRIETLVSFPWGYTDYPLDLDYSVLHNRLAVATNSQLQFYRPYTPAPVETLPPDPGFFFQQVAVDPMGNLVAAAEYNFSLDQAKLLIWNITPGDPLGFTLRHTFTIFGRLSQELMFSPNGTRLAVTGGDGSTNLIEIYDPLAGTLLAQLPHEAYSQSFDFYNTGEILVSVDVNAKIYVWDLTTYTLRNSFSAPNPDGITGGIHKLTFNSAGTAIAYTGNYSEVNVFDPFTGAALGTKILADPYMASYIAYSADDSLLVIHAGIDMLGEGKMYFVDNGSGMDLLNLSVYSLPTLLTPNGYLFMYVFDPVLGGLQWVTWGVLPTP